MNSTAKDGSAFQSCLFRLEQLSPPSSINLGLDRVRDAAVELSLIKPAFPIIIVAGTNGKGSTVATLEAIYTAAGYQCGSYTSPHLFHLNERIKINQKPIANEDFSRALNAVFDVADRFKLTYFEILTLAAVFHFQQAAVDIAILEVGMGGRLDATNIFDADLAIITTIALDHQQYLGDSIEQIAFEKAGVLRHNQLFIYADQRVPSAIYQQSLEKNCQSYYLDKDYFIEKTEEGYKLAFADQSIAFHNDKIHWKNAAAGLLAAKLLNKILPIETIDIEKGIEAIYIPCRRQYIAGQIPHLLDVAHNPQATALLADAIKKHSNGLKVHAVFSCLSDKNLSDILDPLRDCIQHWYPAQLEHERGIDAGKIYQHLKLLNLDTQPVQSATDAYQLAVQQAGAGELIVVFGSFYLLSELVEVIDQMPINEH